MSLSSIIDESENAVLEMGKQIPIPIPRPNSLIPIPIPVPLGFLDSGSDSDSSKKLADSGIDFDSRIGIVHHWNTCMLV